MTTKQDFGYTEMRKIIETMDESHPAFAGRYAMEAAHYLRDFMHEKYGQQFCAFYFMSLGQDAITEPRDA
jgi:hypothetical protein